PDVGCQILPHLRGKVLVQRSRELVNELFSDALLAYRLDLFGGIPDELLEPSLIVDLDLPVLDLCHLRLRARWKRSIELVLPELWIGEVPLDLLSAIGACRDESTVGNICKGRNGIFLSTCLTSQHSEERRLQRRIDIIDVKLVAILGSN